MFKHVKPRLVISAELCVFVHCLQLDGVAIGVGIGVGIGVATGEGGGDESSSSGSSKADVGDGEGVDSAMGDGDSSWQAPRVESWQRTLYASQALEYVRPSAPHTGS